nr:Lrp/AsnC family transcriptional regulator [Planosporangium flavigriseum]
MLAQRGRRRHPVKALTALELAVVKELQRDGRAPNSVIARTVGVTEKTVRRIIGELLERQAIEITAVTFPHLLGYRAMAFALLQTDGTRPRHDVADELAALGSVDYAAITTGPTDLMINAVCQDLDELDSVIENEIHKVAGARLVEVAPYLSLRYQRPSRSGLPTAVPTAVTPDGITMDSLDRDIIRALGQDGRVPYLQLASKLGVSEAQIRLRVKKLTGMGALRIMAIVDPVFLGFDTMAWLAVRLSGHGSASVVESLIAMEPVSYIAETAGSFDLMVELVCIDERELRESLDQIRQMDGIAAVLPHVYFDLYYKPMLLR